MNVLRSTYLEEILREIPWFQSTNEAMRFGKIMGKNQVQALTNARASHLCLVEQFRKQKKKTSEDLNTMMLFATQAQFVREALEVSI